MLLHALQTLRRKYLGMVASKPHQDSKHGASIEPSDLQRLQAELEELKAEKQGLLEHYKILTGNLAAAVIIRDKQQKISYCSPYTEVLTGYPVSEIYAAPDDFLLTIVHPEDREKYQRALKVSETGEPFQFRFRFFHRTGIEMWAETRAVPVNNDAGEPLFSLSVTFDVTGTVRYQRQVEEKNKELRDFTYMVSHDLKAPIFTIKGMVSILSEEYGPTLPGDAKDLLEHIATATGRLDQLVKSVLEYARISATDTKPVRISTTEVLNELMTELKPQLEARHAVIKMADNLPDVMADKLRLYQIFSNLLGNALKYSSPERAPVIEISALQAPLGRNVTIAIQDNGLGIPADKLELVFRPFQRVHKQVAEGSGIGLACVKRLVEKFGGEVHVESNEGQGSCFKVTLRAAP
ncbi:MAG: PAS domain-containing sensor histidine kinase [Oligoflexia bacterium]|nr:PAS domain-containing sensor histidine kinase [Oligoflexia bacterium]